MALGQEVVLIRQRGTVPILFADDLTGAGDVGGGLLAAGRRVVVRVPVRGGAASVSRGQGAVVVDLETRAESEAAAIRAVERAGRALQSCGRRAAYFKIDSTLRGHPFTEGEALRASTGAELAWFVPANPAQGRITVGGRQFVRGVRVERTAFAADAMHPVASGDLVALAGAVVGPRRVAHLNLADLRRGPRRVAALRRGWRRAGCRAVIADAIKPSDLDRLAWSIPAADLPVGAAALAEAIFRRPGRTAVPAARVVARPPSRTLAVIGSLNPVTGSQIQSLAGRRGVTIRRLGRGALRGYRPVAPAGAGCWIVCLDPSAFRSVRPSAVGGIAAALGRIAAAAFTSFGPERLFLSGGLTAVSVCRALGITEFELRGVPCAGITAGSAFAGGRPVEILTKPGGFGSPDALRLLAGAAA